MRFSISKKMWAGFAAVLVLLIIVSVISIAAIFNLSNEYDEVINVDMKKVELADDIYAIQKDLGTTLLEFIMFGRDEAIQTFNEQDQQRVELTESLMAITNDEKSLQLIEQLLQQNELLSASNNQVMTLKKAGEDFSEFSSGSAKINVGVLASLDEIMEIQNANAQITIAEMEKLKSKTTTAIISLVIISILVGLIVAHYISRGISIPVNRVTKGLAEVADGNLNVEPIHLKNKDEIGDMATTYNKMLHDLRDIVSNVRESSTQLTVNAEEFTASSEESLEATKMVATVSESQMSISNNQNDYVDQSVHAMNELQTSVEHISTNNQNMLSATNDVQQLVTKGSNVVVNLSSQMELIFKTFEETTLIMEKMAKHSDEIQQVTGLITGISEQTNLLALNAAIEAARAGDSGKGFAVVADEVRKLAEQSKQSAGEIASIVSLIQTASKNAVEAIANGSEKVESGLAQASESKEVFVQIEGSVGNVVGRVESVSAAIMQVQSMTTAVVANTNEIQHLAKEVVANATDASAATEQQLATIEEISSNAHTLANLADNLQNKVNHFKL